MNNYSTPILEIEKILQSFIKNKKIEPKEIEGKIDNLGTMMRNEQFKLFYEPLSDEQQNIIFNALRNVRLLTTEMRDQLKVAHEKGENPTTAERCISVVPSISNVCYQLDQFQKTRNIKLIPTIERNVRIIRKKAEEYSILPTIEKELIDVELPEKEIKSIFDEFNKNIELELEEQ
jgi:hypothetical protein